MSAFYPPVQYREILVQILGCNYGSASYMIAGSLLVFAGFGCGGKNDAVRINAGGSSFVNPIMEKWSASFKESNGAEINYTKSGSTDGIKQMSVKTKDFGCTDVPMTKEETDAAKKEGGDVIHIPVAMGAVAVIYNIPGIDKQLILDGKTLADIYLSKINSWNDQAIADLNPELKGKLPSIPIILVVRAEGSGTTKIFTEFLSKSNSEFKEKIGAKSSPKWGKAGLEQQGNDGIAGFVEKNAGAIGYVELYYATKFKISFARILNRKGKALAPDDEGAVAAAAEAAMNAPPKEEPYSLHELTFSMTDIDADSAYPICGITYAVLYAKQPEKKGKTIAQFLKWATTDGQQFAKGLGYAPLPAELAKKCHARLDQLKFE